MISDKIPIKKPALSGMDATARALVKFENKDKPIPEVSDRRRHMMAALGAISGMAGSGVIAAAMMKRKLPINPFVAGATIVGSGIILGMTPDYMRTLRLQRAKKISDEQANEALKGLREKLHDYHDLEKKGADKLAAAGFLRGAAGILGKGLKSSGQAVWQGLRGYKNPNIGERVWSAAVRGTALGGAAYGAYRAARPMMGPQSGPNYTTMIRNNMVSGKLGPENLSQKDLVDVRNLGMR